MGFAVFAWQDDRLTWYGYEIQTKQTKACEVVTLPSKLNQVESNN